jgi:hypothetical protein
MTPQKSAPKIGAGFPHVWAFRPTIQALDFPNLGPLPSDTFLSRNKFSLQPNLVSS